jgi:hypothetical protein
VYVDGLALALPECGFVLAGGEQLQMADYLEEDWGNGALFLYGRKQLP